MTDEQRRKIEDLYQYCTFLPASYPKRFAASMHTQPDDYTLSEKQSAYLDKLHHMYRKQIAAAQARGYQTYHTKFA